nr:ribonuclease H-like domain-containing protein [Tanacetum cinerariifolium]
MSVPVTVEEKINKKNDVKAKSLLLMALPNEHQLTFQLVILGVVITQEDLNSKILRSLPPKWNTHVVVWMNKDDIETMGIDDLYNNFKIVEQDVKKSVGTSTGAQNMAFMTAPSTRSTKDVNTANPAYEASTVSPNVNTASPQQDLEQIHKDGLEAMDLRWQLSLLSVRAKRYFQRIGKKIFINANDIAGYDKSKVECFNCHKMEHFSKECRTQRNQDGRFRNKDNTKKQGNNIDTSSKAMLAIDGVGFDWIDMAEEQVQTNKALMVFSDSEDKPQKDDKGFIDSGCSKHMTGNIAYLSDFKEFYGGYVTFRGGAHGGIISGKATKDETSEILKNFIKEIENIVDKKVKIIRCDIGTEFKNKVMDDFCREKGIKREYIIARTPQQNEVAERKNRTLIKAARTMLADSKLPTTF